MRGGGERVWVSWSTQERKAPVLRKRELPALRWQKDTYGRLSPSTSPYCNSQYYHCIRIIASNKSQNEKKISCVNQLTSYLFSHRPRPLILPAPPPATKVSLDSSPENLLAQGKGPRVGDVVFALLAYGYTASS